MLATAATTALFLVVLGELLRAVLHFTVGALAIAGGAILFVNAVRMVLDEPTTEAWSPAGADPMRLAVVPLAVPYLLNPVGIVGLVTISAEAASFRALVVEVAILGVVLLLDAAVFRGADRLGSRFDETRMLVVEKVFGFLIAAIAVQLILDGLDSSGVIT